MPHDCDPHIRALFVVCLVSLEYNKEEALLTPLIQKETEKYGEYYVLIANKYYDKQMFHKSKRFYQITLNKMKQYKTNIGIWIKYGFCCKFLNEINDAIYAFENAVRLDDSNTEAAIALIEFLLKQKRYDEALNIIQASERKEFSVFFLNHLLIGLIS
jgi:tetratricopeptide (TPR) repeat protein